MAYSIVPTNTPLRGFSVWDEHPVYASYLWRREIADAATRNGYWTWVKLQLEPNGRDGSTRKKSK